MQFLYLRTIGVLSFTLSLASSLFGQDTLVLHLEGVLTLAIEQSIELKIAQSETTEQDAAFQNANLEFRPQLFFNGTFPNLNRSIESRPLPNGSDAFVNRATMYNGLGFNLNYHLEKIGGLFSLGTSIERLDVFKSDQSDYQRTYFANLFNVNYIQPFFTFNERRWQKERLSLLNLEFKQRYARKREEIIIQAISYFKNCFLSYERLRLARRQIVETDTLLAIKKRLFDIGKSTRTEILRLNLNQRNNEQNERTELYNWKQAQLELIDFLGLDRNKVILLIEPGSFQTTNISIDQAMYLAVNNNHIKAAQKRMLREAESNLERARKDKDIRLDLNLSLGLNNSANNLDDLWNPILDREIFSASIKLPVTGWQKYKLRQQIAEEQIEQVTLQQDKERINLSQEAFKLVSNFEFLKLSLVNIEERRKGANEILQVISQQFLQGQASYTDFNVALREREQITLEYFNTLLAIIEQYYQIRSLCMYDFELGKALTEE
ncbi:MAG TPA: TolC family protein [Flavilitoribacter sp.]|nr:TolC family protein [Flavilitoribacter sp.]